MGYDAWPGFCCITRKGGSTHERRSLASSTHTANPATGDPSGDYPSFLSLWPSESAGGCILWRMWNLTQPPADALRNLWPAYAGTPHVLSQLWHRAIRSGSNACSTVIAYRSAL